MTQNTTSGATTPSTQTPATQPKTVSVKSFFSQENVRSKFEEIMGNKQKSAAFVSSVLSVVSSNPSLQKAEPQSVYMAAMMAATLDLPINQNLGFAYIIPYKQKKDGQFVDVAQFQLGAKGFKQLALRSGQFKTISDAVIYEGQLVSQDPLKGFVFDFTKPATGKVIGYASYFSLINGFEKTYYMTKEQVEAHAKKYSKTYSYESSTWKKDFDGMALKTVTKMNLSKYAPLSVEMQKATIADQAIIKDVDTLDVDYSDAGVSEITNEELKALYDEKKVKMKVSDQRLAERIINEGETESYAKLKQELEKI